MTNENERKMPVSDLLSVNRVSLSCDLEFEGQRVPNLTKVDSKTTTQQPDVHVDVDKEKDDYVLSKLFKKSGVHSALQHDTIVENSVNDYVFIEAEAHRYAEEAVKALRKSAEECYSAESGIPNWGARNIQHFSSRTFGSRSNKNVVAVVNDDDEEEQTASSSSIVRRSNTGAASASSNLLNDIRQRKRVQTEFVVRTDEQQQQRQHDNGDEESQTNAEGLDLIRELKDYLAGGTSIQGKATTAEIIDHFQERINGQAGLIPKFKSLLKEIAELQRTPSGMGFWVLKEEFRAM